MLYYIGLLLVAIYFFLNAYTNTIQLSPGLDSMVFLSMIIFGFFCIHMIRKTKSG